MNKQLGGWLPLLMLALIIAWLGWSLGQPTLDTLAFESPTDKPTLATVSAEDFWVVDQLGAQADPIVIRDSYAYVGMRYQFAILELSNSGNLVKIGFCLTPGPIWDVTVVGDFAYLVGGRQFQVIDISDPTQPFLVSTYESAAESAALAVSVTGYAYLAHEDIRESGQLLRPEGIQVLDVTQPAAPQPLSFYETRGDPMDFHLVGNRLYVAEYPDYSQSPRFAGGLAILDITNPQQLNQLGYYDVPRHAKALTVRAELVYLVDLYTGLWVVDVADPSLPTLVSNLLTGSERGEDIGLLGDHAYILDRASGLYVVDISAPQTPSMVGEFTDYDYARSLALTTEHAAISAETAILVLDITSPGAPSLVKEFQEPLFPYGVAVGPNGVYVSSVSDGFSVLHADQTPFLATVGYLPMSGVPEILAIHNQRVYGLRPDLLIIDVANPANPVEVGRLELNLNRGDFAVTAEYVYVASGSLQVIEVSDPTDPTPLGSVATGNVWGLALDEPYLYAVGQEGFFILEINTPDNPVLVGTLPGISGESVAADGELACVIDDESLSVIDIGDPGQPVLRSTLDFERSAQDILVAGDLAFVALQGFYDQDSNHTSSGLLVVDLADPSAPESVGFHPLPGAALQIAYQAGRVYFTGAQGGVAVLQYGYPISGQIFDAFGVPFAGIGVQLEAGPRTYTTENGHYSFFNRGSGNYRLIPDHPSYAFYPATRSVEVPPGEYWQTFAVLPPPVVTAVSPTVASSLTYTDTMGYATHLEFPAGAVSVTTTVTVTPTVLMAYGGQKFMGQAFELTAGQSGAQNGRVVFQVPVTVTIPYAAVNLWGISDEQSLVLRWWNNAIWQEATGSCTPAGYFHLDTVANQLEVEICQAGVFGLFGPSNQVFLPGLFNPKKY